MVSGLGFVQICTGLATERKASIRASEMDKRLKRMKIEKMRLILSLF